MVLPSFHHTSQLPRPWLKGLELGDTSPIPWDSPEGPILIHVPIPAAADAGDATQNPKTDEGDPLTGFQSWIFKSLLYAHASPSQHQLCSGSRSYCHFALQPCWLPRDSEEIKFNKSIGGFWYTFLHLYHLFETKILGPSLKGWWRGTLVAYSREGRGDIFPFPWQGSIPA